MFADGDAGASGCARRDVRLAAEQMTAHLRSSEVGTRMASTSSMRSFRVGCAVAASCEGDDAASTLRKTCFCMQSVAKRYFRGGKSGFHRSRALYSLADEFPESAACQIAYFH